MATSSPFARVARWLERPWVRNGLSALLTIGVIVLVIYALHHTLSDVDYRQVLAYIARTPAEAFWFAVAASGASYFVLTGYDFSALRYLGLQQRLPRSAVGVTSFMAYTLSNTVGLGVLAGGAVRMRMFTQWGLTPLQVTRLIAFSAVAFWAGLSTFAAVALLFEAPSVARLVGLPAMLLQALAALVLGVLALLLWCCARHRQLRWGSWQLELPSFGLATRQLGITALDTLFAALTLWFLLPGSDLSWWTFLTFFMLALAAGIISHVPGGLGVFEVVMLTGLGGTLSASSLAAALVLYRVVYYLLPLVMAAALMAGYALWLRLASRSPNAESVARHPTSLGIAQGLAWVAPLLLGAMTFAAGVVLLVSGAVPASQGAEGLQALHVPAFLIEASHLIGSVCGLLLLVLARGIVYRLDAAWWLALLVTALAFWLAVPKGIQWHEIAVLAPLFLLLLVSRGAFHRRSSLVAMRFELGWLVAIASTLAAVGWIVYFALEHDAYSHEQWWQFALDPLAPRALRAAMLVAVAALLWGSWQLLRRPADADEPECAAGPGRWPGDAAARSPADLLLRAQGLPAGGRGATVWRTLHSRSGQAWLHYRRVGRSWVAMADPRGPQDEWPDLIRLFLDAASSHGVRTAFFQPAPARPDWYLDAGLQVHQVGEALVMALAPVPPVPPVSAVDDSGAAAFGWEWLEGASVARSLPVLERLSSQWQQRFMQAHARLVPAPLDVARLGAGPVALLTHAGQAVGFVSLVLPHGDDAEGVAQVDLVRVGDAAPVGLVAQALPALLAQLRERGVERLDLGLAPLPAAELPELASNWHRTARGVFRQGELFHQIDMQALPAGHAVQREARFLAAKGTLSALLVLADLAPVVRRHKVLGDVLRHRAGRAHQP